MRDSPGNRILQLRKTLKLTQQAFADDLGISQRHVSQIENGTREASRQLLMHMCLRYNTSEFWLTTGKGEMFIPLEEAIKVMIARYGERAFYEAIMSIADERALAILAPRAGNKNIDPELDRMLSFLVALWTVGDDDMKAWAKVQFGRAFPSDIEDEVLKKWSGEYGQVSG